MTRVSLRPSTADSEAYAADLSGNDESLMSLSQGTDPLLAREDDEESSVQGHVERIQLNKKRDPRGGLGFNIKGGRDKPLRPGDPGIYVTRLRPSAAADKDGRLQPGDRILEINQRDVRNVTHIEALNAIRDAEGLVTFLVEKEAISFHEPPSDPDSDLARIELRKEKKGKTIPLGFNIRGGVDNPYIPGDPSIYVTRVRSEGAAAMDGRLTAGDKILEINGADMRQSTIDQAVALLHSSKKRIGLLVQKNALQKLVNSAREGTVDAVRGQEVLIDLEKDEDEALGFNIRGGKDANYMRDHSGIFVTSVKIGGVASRDKRLQAGDRILEINGVDVRSVPQDAAVQLVKRAGRKITLLVEQNAEELFKQSEFYNLNFHEEDMSGERGCLFRDGKRQIDFVLVYEQGSEPPEKDILRKRKKFMHNLKKSQLEFEEEISGEAELKTHFIKVHVPWEVLLFYAEELSFRAPLQRRSGMKVNWSDRMLKKLRIPCNPFKDDVPNTPPDYFTVPFQANHLTKFLGHENPDTYFTDIERSRVANEILQTAVYGNRQKGEIGVSRLVEEGIYTAAYPLHVGSADLPPDYGGPGGPDEDKLNTRQVLKEYWARWGKWLKYQPLDHIRQYFGEKIGIYFAWLGQYTAWLLAPAIVGLLVFIYGYATMNGPENLPALDVCNFPNWTFVMCPLCEENLGCKPWDLKKSCARGKIAYLFDNPATVAYAIFVSFWAVLFLEYWKRKEVTMGFHWDVLEFESEEERPRPTFAALAPAVERNPVTGLLEPHFPQEKRFPRIVSGMAVIFIMGSLVMLFMVGVIVYKLLIIHPLYEDPTLQPYANQVVSATGAIVNLIIIMILSKVYDRLALVLTQWEMHRTQTEYEDNLTFKVFVFQFMNFYSSIFYIAFFKGKLVGYPGNYTRIFGLRNEECSPGGCLIELAQQLAVIMVGKQIIGNVQEVFVPELKKYLRKRKRKKAGGSDVDDEGKPRWEQDYELLDNEGLFQEYLEMIIQFGFITIFVAAFPLAPFFALANNIFEIRIDSDKMVCDVRRPVADRAQDIGIWFKILESITKIAVISNAFLIAFTSNFLPKLLYKALLSPDGTLKGYAEFSLAWAPPNATSVPCRYIDFRDPDGNFSKFYWHLLTLKLGFVILFEHIVFGVSQLIDMLVPDVPGWLDQQIKRESYLAKQALASHHGLMANDDSDKNEVHVELE